jgi:glucose 1-dehydrogenase
VQWHAFSDASIPITISVGIARILSPLWVSGLTAAQLRLSYATEGARTMQPGHCFPQPCSVFWRAPHLNLDLRGISMRLVGKKVLVTGAARGIGRGCALELARAGADVMVNDRELTAQAAATVAEIQALGQQSVFLPGDVFERQSCEILVERACKAFERIDIFVSNPAFQRRAPFLEFDAEVFAKVIQGTLAGGFYMSQLVARHMVNRGGKGKIIFISSGHAHTPYVNSIAYNAGKAGLNQLAFTIAAELYPHRINVNVIEPGWIDTPGEHEAFGDEFMSQTGVSLPWGRFGTPEDIGKAAVFLASDDAEYITGAALRVDGGIGLQHARE